MFGGRSELEVIQSYAEWNARGCSMVGVDAKLKVLEIEENNRFIRSQQLRNLHAIHNKYEEWRVRLQKELQKILTEFDKSITISKDQMLMESMRSHIENLSLINDKLKEVDDVIASSNDEVRIKRMTDQKNNVVKLKETYEKWKKNFELFLITGKGDSDVIPIPSVNRIPSNLPPPQPLFRRASQVMCDEIKNDFEKKYQYIPDCAEKTFFKLKDYFTFLNLFYGHDSIKCIYADSNNLMTNVEVMRSIDSLLEQSAAENRGSIKVDCVDNLSRITNFFSTDLHELYKRMLAALNELISKLDSNDTNLDTWIKLKDTLDMLANETPKLPEEILLNDEIYEILKEDKFHIQDNQNSDIRRKFNSLVDRYEDTLMKYKNYCRDVCDIMERCRKTVLHLDFSKLIFLIRKAHEAENALEGKEVTLFLGGSGTGKSTTIHKLGGSKMVCNYVGENKMQHIYPVDPRNSLVPFEKLKAFTTTPFTISETLYVKSIDIYYNPSNAPLSKQTVVVPSLSEGVVSGIVEGWTLEAGDAVPFNTLMGSIRVGETTFEIRSPCSGRIEQLSVSNGDSIRVGAPLCTIVEGYVITLGDSPGFGETRGREYEIANSCGLSRALSKCKSVKPVILLSEKAEGFRSAGFLEQTSVLYQLFSNIEQSKQSFCYYFTRVPETPDALVAKCGVLRDLLRNNPNDTVLRDLVCKTLILKGNLDVNEKDIIIKELKALGKIQDGDDRNEKLQEFADDKSYGFANILRPLTDNRDVLCQRLLEVKPIENNGSLIQTYLIEKALTDLEMQLNKHSSSISEALGRRDTSASGLIYYKMEQLKQIAYLLGFKQCQDVYNENIEVIRRSVDRIRENIGDMLQIYFSDIQTSPSQKLVYDIFLEGCFLISLEKVRRLYTTDIQLCDCYHKYFNNILEQHMKDSRKKIPDLWKTRRYEELNKLLTKLLYLTEYAKTTYHNDLDIIVQNDEHLIGANKNKESLQSYLSTSDYFDVVLCGNAKQISEGLAIYYQSVAVELKAIFKNMLLDIRKFCEQKDFISASRHLNDLENLEKHCAVHLDTESSVLVQEVDTLIVDSINQEYSLCLSIIESLDKAVYIDEVLSPEKSNTIKVFFINISSGSCKLRYTFCKGMCKNLKQAILDYFERTKFAINCNNVNILDKRFEAHLFLKMKVALTNMSLLLISVDGVKELSELLDSTKQMIHDVRYTYNKAISESISNLRMSIADGCYDGNFDFSSVSYYFKQCMTAIAIEGSDCSDFKSTCQSMVDYIKSNNNKLAKKFRPIEIKSYVKLREYSESYCVACALNNCFSLCSDEDLLLIQQVANKCLTAKSTPTSSDKGVAESKSDEKNQNVEDLEQFRVMTQHGKEYCKVIMDDIKYFSPLLNECSVFFNEKLGVTENLKLNDGDVHMKFMNDSLNFAYNCWTNKIFLSTSKLGAELPIDGTIHRIYVGLKDHVCAIDSHLSSGVRYKWLAENAELPQDIPRFKSSLAIDDLVKSLRYLKLLSPSIAVLNKIVATVITTDQLAVNSHVQCRYKNSRELFSCEIVAIETRPNGEIAYAVKYDDDEIEHDVPRRKIKVKSTDMQATPYVGMVVDAKCVNNEILPAIVTRIISPDSIEVKFEVNNQLALLKRNDIFCEFQSPKLANSLNSPIIDFYDKWIDILESRARRVKDELSESVQHNQINGITKCFREIEVLSIADEILPSDISFTLIRVENDDALNRIVGDTEIKIQHKQYSRDLAHAIKNAGANIHNLKLLFNSSIKTLCDNIKSLSNVFSIDTSHQLLGEINKLYNARITMAEFINNVNETEDAIGIGLNGVNGCINSMLPQLPDEEDTIDYYVLECALKKAQDILTNVTMSIERVNNINFTIDVDVDATDTIKSLKEKVLKREGIPVDQQRLVMAGVHLEDGQNLSFYNINSPNLTLCVRGSLQVFKTNITLEVELVNSSVQTVERKQGENNEYNLILPLYELSESVTRLITSRKQSISNNLVKTMKNCSEFANAEVDELSDHLPKKSLILNLRRCQGAGREIPQSLQREYATHYTNLITEVANQFRIVFTSINYLMESLLPGLEETKTASPQRTSSTNHNLENYRTFSVSDAVKILKYVISEESEYILREDKKKARNLLTRIEGILVDVIDDFSVMPIDKLVIKYKHFKTLNEHNMLSNIENRVNQLFENVSRDINMPSTKLSVALSIVANDYSSYLAYNSIVVSQRKKLPTSELMNVLSSKYKSFLDNFDNVSQMSPKSIKAVLPFIGDIADIYNFGISNTHNLEFNKALRLLLDETGKDKEIAISDRVKGCVQKVHECFRKYSNILANINSQLNDYAREYSTCVITIKAFENYMMDYVRVVDAWENTKDIFEYILEVAEKIKLPDYFIVPLETRQNDLQEILDRCDTFVNRSFMSGDIYDRYTGTDNSLDRDNFYSSISACLRIRNYVQRLVDRSFVHPSPINYPEHLRNQITIIANSAIEKLKLIPNCDESAYRVFNIGRDNIRSMSAMIDDPAIVGIINSTVSTIDDEFKTKILIMRNSIIQINTENVIKSSAKVADEIVKLKRIGTMVLTFCKFINDCIDEALKEISIRNNGAAFIGQLSLHFYKQKYSPIGNDILSDQKIFKYADDLSKRREFQVRTVEDILQNPDFRGSADLDLNVLLSDYRTFHIDYWNLVHTGTTDPGIKDILPMTTKMIAGEMVPQGDETLLRKKILSLIVHIFAYWTLSDLDAYNKNKESAISSQNQNSNMTDEEKVDAAPVEAQDFYYTQPHPGQIVSVFRILGLGVSSKKDSGFFSIALEFASRKAKQAASQFIDIASHPLSFPNHFVQLLTGEGKSVVLAVVCTTLALLNFDVDCACYSEYLSKRDFKSFESLFTAFGVLNTPNKNVNEKIGNVRYDTFDQLSNGFLNETVNIRKAVESVLEGQSFQLNERSNNCRARILVIDEVDVFLNSEYYSSPYLPVAQIRSDEAKSLIKYIWNNFEGTNADLVSAAHDIVSQIQNSTEYKLCQANYQKWEELVDISVQRMVVDLLSYDKANHEYEVYHGKVWYKQGDKKVDNKVIGYKTMWAYFKAFKDALITEDQLENQICLSLYCASFGYSKIPTMYHNVLGITGTLETLTIAERKVLDNYNINRYTMIPSVYGVRQFTVTDVVIVPEDTYHSAIADEINRRLQGPTHGSKLAVLVFFETTQELNRFRDSPAAVEFRNNRVLTENVPMAERSEKVKCATTAGQVTLLSKEIGRGTDFRCRDKVLNRDGGIHVIQTFLSKSISEEKQIEGRTARQGHKGSYSMILRESSLDYILSDLRPEDEAQIMKATNGQLSEISSDILLAKLKEGSVAERRKLLSILREIKYVKQYESDNQYIGEISQRHDDSNNFMRDVIGIKDTGIITPQILNFLITLNPPVLLTQEDVCSRTICLIDATGSMGGVLDAMKTAVINMFDHVAATLKAEKITGSFEIMIGVYRNYNSGGDIFKCTTWERDSTILSEFMRSPDAKCSGGIYGHEAIEVALQSINASITPTDNVSQILLIGDVGPHERDEIVKRRAKYNWPNMPPQTYYQDEVQEIKNKNIPIHTFFVETETNKRLLADTERYFTEIAEATGGHCQKMDPAELKNIVCKKVLRDIGTRKKLGSERLDQLEDRLMSLFGQGHTSA